MNAERPDMISVKQEQFNDPENHNQTNTHAGNAENTIAVPSQQIMSRMTDIRLNADLHRLRKFKMVAMKSAWYNNLAAKVLHE